MREIKRGIEEVEEVEDDEKGCHADTLNSMPNTTYLCPPAIPPITTGLMVFFSLLK